MRYVSCRDEQGSVADESACFHLPKPSATEVCTVTPCGQWKALEWSSVSITLHLAGKPCRRRCWRLIALIWCLYKWEDDGFEQCFISSNCWSGE